MLSASDPLVLQDPDHHSAILCLTFSRLRNFVGPALAQFLVHRGAPHGGGMAFHLDGIAGDQLCLLNQLQQLGVVRWIESHFTISEVDIATINIPLDHPRP
jgi:hypothetical protein